jgi:2-polyprenyl-6-methoxyphenol hydroxylase-like FAD-dependent oxidoreductase
MSQAGNHSQAAERVPRGVEVLVVGAGPVGLLVALLLGDAGFEVLVIEPRMEINAHSRAIGIHPPGLASLERAGLADMFEADGIQVPGGWAYVNGVPVGRLDLSQNPGKWKFPMVMPQYKTEYLLEQAVLAHSSIRLLRGIELTHFEQHASEIECRLNEIAGEAFIPVRCHYLIGCDGKKSAVRQQAGIPFPGGPYPDRYVLGDCEDITEFGNDAIINLHRDGMMESFPMSGAKRRWVARLASPLNDEIPLETQMTDAITRRLGEEFVTEEWSLINTFGIERYLAKTVAAGQVYLVGDAAHVVSPVGGQGMNLGWMDACDLADTLIEQRNAESIDAKMKASERYNHKVRHRARIGIRRAWFNTILGRNNYPNWIRSVAVHSIISPMLQGKFVQQFTMSDL